MAQQISGNDLQGWDCWIWVGGGTRVSGTSLTITGDYTSIISPGDKLKLTDTTTKYFYVLAPVTFSAGVTTLTITGGSDYTLVGTPSAISYSKDVSPAGFPQWFNWTPTFGGFSSNPTGVHRFKIDGRSVTLSSSVIALGTSNANTFTMTVPVTAATVTNMIWRTPLNSYNNSALSTTVDYTYMPSAASTLQLAHNDSTTGWTTSGTKGASFQVVYEF